MVTAIIIGSISLFILAIALFIGGPVTHFILHMMRTWNAHD